ncbi:hypothetical protein B0H16DRAFT_1737330 [Mycena metata]|uniref:CxC2-like cysteine cluster KDZ transposase-associated domain-containing protein n=1 Tax=Mycena metata TaxID=1033252 RepID=A0AAD7MLX1_9AGAR|nr:hypothetical protein B0H16DRAFT_1737330 [Mycena metata]
MAPAKKRKGTLHATIDASDSDSDGYTEQTATVTKSGKVTKSNVRVHPANKKFKATQIPTPVPDPILDVEEDFVEDEDVDAEIDGKPQVSTQRKWHVESHERIYQYLIEAAIFQTLSSAQLASGTQVQCACKEPAEFRCPECGITDMLCGQCLVKMHPGHRFHHIEKWDGSGFVRVPLLDLGHAVHLEHNGAVCPNGGRVPVGRKTVFVDTNGIHEGKTLSGDCRRTTVFTFDVLNNFHVHNLVSKKTASDYYRALRKLTSGAFPHLTPDRVREFIRIVRVWRNIVMRRRAGQTLTLNIDHIIVNRRPNSLAVRCPACPEVDFNVEKAVIDAARENKKHKYTLFLSSDGNFKLQRKRKVDDPDDVALNDGNAYFPDDTTYKKYVAVMGRHDDKCTCSELKAVRMQNIVKFKNAVITGVVAVQCARHGFFMPGGMVDLTRGEGFGHTDYALGQSLLDGYDQRWVVLTYDVYCQYFKNITTRFRDWFPQLIPLISQLGGAVPKMHIRNHIAQCQSQWSTNFQEFLAFLIGELIEGSWAEMNQFAGSTKETNHGHRHDIIDDGCGQWNWDKVIQMGQTLQKMYRDAQAAIRKREPPFKALTETTDPALIKEWSAMATKWEIKKGKYSSPYDAHIENGPPTHRSAYEKLLLAELNKSMASGVIGSGDTVFITKGLLLEKEQHRIKVILKTSTLDKAVRRKSKLRTDITTWRVAQLDRFPTLQREVDGPKVAPEETRLLLPSSFDASRRRILQMVELATTEYQLREGMAHDALQDVRNAIKTFNFNLKFMVDKKIRGQAAGTRAQSFLRTLANDRVIAANEYRTTRGALLSLGLREDDSTLQPLADNELYSKNNTDSTKIGESKEVDPWFWSVGRPAGMSAKQDKEWSVEIDRVKWFRDRANLQRAKEQAELVDVEFDRTITAFEKSASAWKILHSECMPGLGEASYAHNKYLMYIMLAQHCSAAKVKAPGLSEKDEEDELAKALDLLKKKKKSNQELPEDWECFNPSRYDPDAGDSHVSRRCDISGWNN